MSSYAPRWLLLIHQLPAKPAYARVKVWRRLQTLGAVTVKGAVYALPANPETREDFAWLAKEIGEAGGEAIICEATLTEGLSDAELQALFDTARDEDYGRIAAEASELVARGGDRASDGVLAEIASQTVRLRKQLDSVAAIDFFGAEARATAEGLVSGLEAGLKQEGEAVIETTTGAPASAALKDRVWVTREGVQVDRIASAWLIRHFIDNTSVFKVVDGKNYKPAPGELRFDMSDAEFTHEGSDCTFETLLRHADLNSNPALCAIAEIVHDLDLEDGRFGRPETMGLGAMIAGICAKATSDEERLILGGEGLNQFYSYFCAK